jgi:hypothetical protein
MLSLGTYDGRHTARLMTFQSSLSSGTLAVANTMLDGFVRTFVGGPGCAADLAGSGRGSPFLDEAKLNHQLSRFQPWPDSLDGNRPIRVDEPAETNGYPARGD